MLLLRGRAATVDRGDTWLHGYRRDLQLRRFRRSNGSDGYGRRFMEVWVPAGPAILECSGMPVNRQQSETSDKSPVYRMGGPCSRTHELGLNFNWSAHWNETPYFFDLGICHCNAAIGPVHVTQQRAQPCEAVLDSVNHNRAAGIDSFIVSPFPVRSAGIRNMQREMEPAPGILLIDHILSLGSFVIALMIFWPSGPSSECDLVDLQNLPLRRQSHCVGGFHNHDLIRFLFSLLQVRQFFRRTAKYA